MGPTGWPRCATRSTQSPPSGSAPCRWRRASSHCHRPAGHLVKASVTDEQEPDMRVFVAGATGAMGKQLVPRLMEAGHQVIGMTRSESKQGALWDLGAEPVVADALDPDQVAEAVARTQPEVIVHQLTA